MQNVQHILVPTDFSDSANSALVYAITLAERIHAQLHVLHVLKDGATLEDIDYDLEKIKHDYLSRCRENVEIYVRDGYIKENIDKIVNELRIDLVIIGMQGASYKEGATFGSLTSTLIAEPPCAVLSLPRDCKTLNFDHIAVTSDMRLVPNPPEVYTLSFLAEALKSEVSIFHVNYHTPIPNEHKVKERFEELFRHNIHSFHEVNSESVMNAVNEFSENHDVDMVAVLHKMKLHKNPVHRSTSKQFIFGANRPLLIIPIREH